MTIFHGYTRTHPVPLSFLVLYRFFFSYHMAFNNVQSLQDNLFLRISESADQLTNQFLQIDEAIRVCLLRLMRAVLFGGRYKTNIMYIFPFKHI